MLLQKFKEKQFCFGHNILTEGVFVTQLPSNAGISAWQIELKQSAVLRAMCRM